MTRRSTRRFPTATALFLLLGLGVPAVSRAEASPSLLLRAVDRAGRPIAGATVQASWSTEGGEQRRLRETTSPQGTFRLTGLPPEETFWISVEKAGFTPEVRSVSASPEAQWELRITLRPGNLAVGRVVDEEGRPVAGAEIEVSAAPGTILPSPRSTRSGPAGRFRFRDLPAGQLALTIRHPGYAPLEVGHPVEGGRTGRLGTFVLRRGTTLRGLVTDAAGFPVAGARIWALTSEELYREGKQRASAVTAADGTFVVPRRPPGEELSLWVCADGFLQAADTVPFPDEPIGVMLERAAAVQGRVLDPDGAPRPGATVSIEQANGDFGCSLRIWSPCPADESAIADADGRFAVGRLDPGWYDLVASAPGLLAGVVEDLRLAAGEAGEEQEIRLGRGVEVTGRVLAPDGAPIPGAQLRAWTGRSSQESRSGPDGSFRLAGVDAGTLRISATAERFEDDLIEIEVAAGGATADIVLQPDEDEESVEVHGRVLGPDGSPVEGALVSVGGRSVSSERDGAFKVRICGCRSDEPQEVVARKRGFARGRTTVLLEGKRVEGVEVRLENGTEIRGRVSGPGDRASITISIAAPGRDGGERTSDDPVFADAEGRFRLGPIPAGTWVVQAHSGDRLAQATVILEPGQAEAYVELAFEPGQEVSGRVLDPDGRPAAHAALSAGNGNGEDEHTWTHNDGTFSLRVPEGDVTLSIDYRDLRRQQALQIGDGPVTGVEIRLERGAVLSGHVLGLSPGDLPMITLRGPGSEATLVEPDGSWSTRSLSPGTWQLEALLFRDNGAQVIRRALEISPEASEVSLDLDFTGVPVTDAQELFDNPPPEPR
jgi:protocatechuate 3,4-dioxygenase beta subunit